MTFPKTFSSHSPEETERVGAMLAEALLTEPALPAFVAMYGDLGVGKTAFTRGFVSRIAPDARVKSPTFSLVHEYKGQGGTVFHFDMYRIESEDELESVGFYDYLDRHGFCLVEWSEKIPYALPDCYLRVEIRKDSAEDADSRSISLTLVGARPQNL